MTSNNFEPWSSEDALRPLYDRLRWIARSRLSGQSGHTLSPTGLVNEALARLLAAHSGKTEPAVFHDEEHFIAAACEAMRHVLVDHARRKAAAKRQGGIQGDDFKGAAAGFELRIAPEALLDINRELERLRETNAELARLVEMRVFGGLTFAEAGALLGMETKTAERRWRYAAALLRDRLGGAELSPAYVAET